MLTITPINPQDEFIIYTDFDLRNDYQGVDVAANFGANKSNLQSANKYIQNLGNSSSVYTVASPFQKEINVNLPALDSIFIRSNLNVNNSENIIKKIPLGSINEASFFGEYDITTEGKLITRSLTFRITDGFDNLIDFQGDTLSFRLAFVY